MRVFERLGILEKYASVAEMYEDGSTRTKFISWQDSSEIADVKTLGLSSSAHRKRVLEVLVSLLPPNVQTHFSARIIGVSNIPASAQRQDHAILEIAAATPVHDGQVQAPQQTWTFEADAVIGADGVKSVVRELVDVNAGVRWTGSCIYRSLLSMERAKQVNSDFRTATVWIGPSKVGGFFFSSSATHAQITHEYLE
jgi:2-polyprenyl-6-methoxyphenol hydroxylase-like FAD-dependent oxidoreductase